MKEDDGRKLLPIVKLKGTEYSERCIVARPPSPLFHVKFALHYVKNTLHISIKNEGT